jgi:hypothetical protein
LTARSSSETAAPIKGGGILRTVEDARDHLLTLGPQRSRHDWQRAGELILAQVDVESVTSQFHKALFLDGAVR